MGWWEKASGVVGLWIFVSGLLWHGGLRAAPVSPHRNFAALDVGVFGSNLNERVIVPKAMQSEVSTIAGFARARWGIHLSRSLFFEPSFATLIPWRSGADGTVKTFT